MCDIKIGVFGNLGCEKTQLTLRFLRGDCNSNYMSDDFVKILNIDGNSIKLTIFDTAGQDEFNEMRFMYYSKIQAAILVFDISNPQSIDSIKSIYQEIQNNDNDLEIKFAVAANRGYLRDQKSKNLISTDLYKGLEKYFNCKIFETNAQTGKNVDEIFHYVIKECINLLNSDKGDNKHSKNKIDKKKKVQLKAEPRNMHNSSSSSDLKNQSKEKFPSKKDQRNSQTIDRAALTAISSDIVKKRSVSIVPKMISKNNEPLEVFSNPIGDEIKKVLQSRTKQLQQALEDKKQLENIIKQKDEELQKAYDRIKELENLLTCNNGC